MKITYDKEIDAMYIQLVEGVQQVRTLRLNRDFALDIGKGEVLVGIEILDATETLGKGALPKLTVENVPMETSMHP